MTQPEDWVDEEAPTTIFVPRTRVAARSSGRA